MAKVCESKRGGGLCLCGSLLFFRGPWRSISVGYSVTLFSQSFITIISDPCPRLCSLVTVWVDIIEYSMRTLALQSEPLKP